MPKTSLKALLEFETLKESLKQKNDPQSALVEAQELYIELKQVRENLLEAEFLFEKLISR